jgi:hypothetical protein
MHGQAAEYVSNSSESWRVWALHVRLACFQITELVVVFPSSVSITADHHRPRSLLSLMQAHSSFAMPRRKQELEAK